MKVRRELALAYEETGKHGDAEEAFKDLLASMEAEWGPDDQQTLDVKEEFAQVLDKHGKPEEAAQQRSRPIPKPVSRPTSSEIDDSDEELLRKFMEKFEKHLNEHKEPEEVSKQKGRRHSQPPPHDSKSDSSNSDEEFEKFWEEIEKSLNAET